MKSLGCIIMICAGSILLSACGQTGPLYMPGTATGVHKKDVFILGNKPENNTTAAPATTDSAKSTKTDAGSDNAKSPETNTMKDNVKPTDMTSSSNKDSSQMSTNQGLPGS